MTSHVIRCNHPYQLRLAKGQWYSTDFIGSTHIHDTEEQAVSAAVAHAKDAFEYACAGHAGSSIAYGYRREVELEYNLRTGEVVARSSDYLESSTD